MTILKTTELYNFKWVNLVVCEFYLNKPVKKNFDGKRSNKITALGTNQDYLKLTSKSRIFHCQSPRTNSVRSHRSPLRNISSLEAAQSVKESVAFGDDPFGPHSFVRVSLQC